MNKISIRFFGDREVRAVWDDAQNEWWFCAVDVAAVLNGSKNPSNYWYVLKNRLKKSKLQFLTNCKGLELRANDGKLRAMDCFDGEGIVVLAETLPMIERMPETAHGLTCNRRSISSPPQQVSR